MFPVFPGVLEGGVRPVHPGGERHVPRVFFAAPYDEECVRVGQLCGDGGGEHPAPAAASGVNVDGEFRTGESLFCRRVVAVATLGGRTALA